MEVKEVLKLAGRDEEAFSELYDYYFERFYQFFAYRVGRQEDIEDLNSLLWERVFKNLKKVCKFEVAVFEAWCFRVARNLIADFYRAKGRKGESVSLESAFNLSDNFDVAASVKSKSDLEKLISQVEKLPVKQREIFKLRYFDEFSNKEIAEILKMGEKTVASNLSRGKSFLKDSFLKCSNYLALFVVISVLIK